MVVATKVTLPSTWPASLSVATGSGNVLFWLLSTYDVDAQNVVTGKSWTCRTSTPPLTLNSTGATSVMAPAGATAQVQILVADSTWNRIYSSPTMQHTDITGRLGGWTVGSSTTVDRAVTLVGLKPSSSYAMSSTTWPANNANGTAIDPADLQDDDNDGKPGFTSMPSTMNGFYAPRSAATGGDPLDALYLVSRSELTFCGTSVDCTTWKGSVTVIHYDNHVVGCHKAADAGVGPDAGGDCNMAEYGFIDGNSTIYGVTTGTYETVQLSTSSGMPTCADVLAALP